MYNDHIGLVNIFLRCCCKHRAFKVVTSNTLKPKPRTHGAQGGCTVASGRVSAASTMPNPTAPNYMCAVLKPHIALDLCLCGPQNGYPTYACFRFNSGSRITQGPRPQINKPPPLHGSTLLWGIVQTCTPEPQTQTDSPAGWWKLLAGVAYKLG